MKDNFKPSWELINSVEELSLKAMKRARAEAKLTQKELAERLGVSKQTVYNIERGARIGRSWRVYLPKFLQWMKACNAVLTMDIRVIADDTLVKKMRF